MNAFECIKLVLNHRLFCGSSQSCFSIYAKWLFVYSKRNSIQQFCAIIRIFLLKNIIIRRNKGQLILMMIVKIAMEWMTISNMHHDMIQYKAPRFYVDNNYMYSVHQTLFHISFDTHNIYIIIKPPMFDTFNLL